MTFIGREHELAKLEQLYAANTSKLVVVYGRRRIGKSALIEQFMKNKNALHFEGLEGASTKEQLAQLIYDLSEQVNDPILKEIKPSTWQPILDYLTKVFSQSKTKTILFLDEFQWLSINQSKLVSLIKKIWDTQWSKQNVMLILCGSVCSFMTSRVISSKALYGRVHWECNLMPLNAAESYALLRKKRHTDEVMLYLLTLGGIPKYLCEIDLKKSFDQNINTLVFTKDGFLLNDYEKVFYSQFREYQTYETIVQCLKEQPLSLNEIAENLKLPSGGGLKSYLTNLEKASFITRFSPYNKTNNTKLIKYKLSDPYLRFYFKYIEPHKRLISQNRSRSLFTELVKPHWYAWLGFAFENYCLMNAMELARLMGFESAVTQWGPYFERGDTGFQIDLIFLRNDKVATLCEIKFYDSPISVEVVREVERKCQLLSLPHGTTLEKALISRVGPDASLQKLNYFDHYVTVEDFFKP